MTGMKPPPMKYLFESEDPRCPWCLNIISDLKVKWEDVQVVSHPAIDGAVIVSGEGRCPDCDKPVSIKETLIPDDFSQARYDLVRLSGQVTPELTERDQQYIKLANTGSGQ